MSFWKKIGILKDEGTETPEANSATPQKSVASINQNAQPLMFNAAGPPVAPASDPIQNPLQVTGTINEKMAQGLFEAIEKANLPGQNYYAFRKSLDAMANVPMDERNKFMSTFAVLSVQGCTRNVLLSSIEHYIGVIKTEQKEFEQELAQEMATRVQKRMDSIEKAKKELEALQNKMAEVNTFIINTSQEAQAEKLKLDTSSANFTVTSNYVIGKLMEDKQNIEMYIPAPIETSTK